MKNSTLKNKTRRQLRADIRKQRQSLSRQKQALASRQLLKKLNTSRLLLRCHHIALYLGSDGEICPSLLIKQLRRCKQKIYLPVIHPLKKKEIIFCRFEKNTKLIKNRFGIEEPEFNLSKQLPAKYLSLVLVPLVAFDENGNRMGMGGGFYDKAFAFKINKPHRKPTLIGLAHDFQRQEKLTVETWDVPLHGVMTEKKFYA